MSKNVTLRIVISEQAEDVLKRNMKKYKAENYSALIEKLCADLEIADKAKS